jgi:hypothetical protein
MTKQKQQDKKIDSETMKEDNNEQSTDHQKKQEIKFTTIRIQKVDYDRMSQFVSYPEPMSQTFKRLIDYLEKYKKEEENIK